MAWCSEICFRLDTLHRCYVQFYACMCVSHLSGAEAYMNYNCIPAGLIKAYVFKHNTGVPKYQQCFRE